MKSDQQKTCGNCTHWARQFDERIPDHGGCAQRPAGYLSHQNSACLLFPLHWKAKK